MKPDCRQFRARLAEALRTVPEAQAPAIGELQWHGHVVHCEACQSLLAEEEALEELLRSLPQPHLPRALAERVLSRLDGARRPVHGGLDLDRLLELSPDEPAPAHLVRGVIARVHAEHRLEILLARVPAPVVPAGLERRVLARLELARRAKPVPQHWSARPALRIAAGLAVLGLTAWGVSSLRRDADVRTTPEIATGGDPSDPGRPDPTPGIETPAPDEQLLASLELLEAWDLLASDDGLDASLATLDSMDEYLLDFGFAASSSDAAPAKEVPAAPESAPKSGEKG